MNFYRIGCWEAAPRKYPWVAGFGPLSNMPFFEAAPVFWESKKRFWQVNPRPPGLFFDSGGREWSDVVGCGGGPPGYFVSERLLRDIEEAGVPILRATEMPIVEIKGKRLQKLPPPRYFVLEAAPGIATAYEAMGIRIGEDGKPIWTSEDVKRRPPLLFKRASWDGSHLFSFYGNMPMNVYCSQYVVDLAERKGWTNVDFEPVECT